MDNIAELRSEAARNQIHSVWTKGGPVFSQLSEDTVHRLEGRTIASFGDAATLGMWAFATGIWTTGLFQSKLLPPEQMELLFPGMLVYAGLVLFIAGLFLFRRNNNFLGSSFCLFAALNVTRAVLLISQNHGVLPTDTTANVLEGCLLESFAYIALSLLVGVPYECRVGVGAGLYFSRLCARRAAAANQPNRRWRLRAGRADRRIFHVRRWVLCLLRGTALLVNTAWQRALLPIGGRA